MKSDPSRGAGIQSISDALAILECFQTGPAAWSRSALAQELGLNRAKTYRLLAALEGEGLVVQDEAGSGLQLGAACVILAGRALRANPLRELARDELRRLADQTQETATLDVLEGAETVVIDEVKGRFMLGMASSIGTRWPVHASSTGKVLLSHLPETELVAILGSELEYLTAATICSPTRLRVQLEEARQRGFASAQGELEAGYSDLSAPIFDHRGRVVAAISLGGATARFSGGTAAGMAQSLIESAARISFQLGYRADLPVRRQAKSEYD